MPEAVFPQSFASWLSRRTGAIQSVSQSSQVQTIADYAKQSLSSDQPMVLTPKEVHPLLRCCTLHKDAHRITGGLD
jgi:hypothetical protein